MKQLLKCKLREDGWFCFVFLYLGTMSIVLHIAEAPKICVDEEEKHVNKYRDSDKGLESDEIRMEMRGLNLDRLVGERTFQELTFGDGNGNKEIAMWVLRAVFQRLRKLHLFKEHGEGQWGYSG